jgi:hypothetical protein
MAIGVIVVVLVWVVTFPSFYIQGAGVIRKILGSFIIVVIVRLYLYSFLITRFYIIKVGLYL